MPRAVDRAEREGVIADAALRLMAKSGPSAVTLRGLADELGGSITLVTHFYPTRTALFEGITSRLLADYDEELAQLERDSDPRTRLRVLLTWLLPLSKESRALERARVLMTAETDSEVHVQAFFTAMEQKMRGLLRSHLEPFVAPREVELYVDALRALTNGIVLSATEHPRLWSRKRQLAVLDLAISSLGLDQQADV
jgi:AcrR family transcriptional regulator